MRFAVLAFILVLNSAVGKASAHEFWIDPLVYSVPEETTVEARLRVGQLFAGAAVSYLPRNFTRFEVIQGETTVSVEGRLGDDPALSMEGLQDGLAIIVHETTDNRLTWDEWERFVAFAEHKDLGDVTAFHEARGLSQEDVREVYVRYAKSLVAIGDGGGADRPVGLRTEIVALANPYTDDMTEGLPVRVLLDGAPRPGAQVELFARDPAGEVVVTLHRADDDGVAVLPVEAGYSYLADAVVLEAVEPDQPRDPVWRTLWASLTFAVPAP